MSADDERSRPPRAPILPDECACIVVAGGQSRRMGRPKASLPFGDVSLLERVVTRVAPLVREVVIVAAAEQALPPLVARVIRDRVPGEGPLPAVALGLASVTTPWAFALACDTPFVRGAVLRALAAASAGASAVIPRWDNRLQPLVALYHRSLAGPLARLAVGGERRLHVVATRPDVRVLPAEQLAMHDPEGSSFRSLDTPEQYEDAVRRWHAAGATDD